MLRSALAGAFLIGLFLLVVVPVGLSYYDSVTKQKVLRMIAAELPVGASMAQMDEFMNRHTARYAFNEYPRMEYAGFLPQSSLDRVLADRAVQVALEVNKGTKTFARADVRIYYTGP